ncbi:SpdD protein [Streptomyces chumphonensis]|uniref:SpdD protein n=1 Tax=Streptomyces chumphonensis TaxID=1214925 RepID=A0A927IBP4_9ACTN|nr:SpdD protein [Streptomyces chumphonensis]MBD3933148.1 SpdD protein [Streptomyces chumphonensis]
MFFRPELPTPPQVPAQPHAAVHPSLCSCQTASPIPAATRTASPSLLSGRSGAVVGVLLGGVVLTALLTAVAVTAVSVAITGVVLRSLLTSQRNR